MPATATEATAQSAPGEVDLTVSAVGRSTLVPCSLCWRAAATSAACSESVASVSTLLLSRSWSCCALDMAISSCFGLGSTHTLESLSHWLTLNPKKDVARPTMMIVSHAKNCKGARRLASHPALLTLFPPLHVGEVSPITAVVALPIHEENVVRLPAKPVVVASTKGAYHLSRR